MVKAEPDRRRAVDGVAVVVGVEGAVVLEAGEDPVERAGAVVGEHGVLPLVVDRVANVLLENAPLAGDGAVTQPVRVGNVPGDPLRAPLGRLAPAVRVEVVGDHVHKRQLRERDRIDSLAAVHGEVGRGGIVAIEAFVAGPEQVLAVDALNEAAHVLCPRGDGVGGAAVGARVDAVAVASFFVGELPHQDGRVVLVLDAGVAVGVVEQVLDPVLVPLADGGVGIELVVVLQTLPAHVLIHAAELVIVIDERDHELQVELPGLVDHVVELLEAVGAIVEGGLRAVPVMKVDAVVRAIDGVRAVLVADIYKAPGAHRVEVLGGGGRQDVVDHELRRVHQVVVVGPGRAKRPALVHEAAAGAGGEVMAAGVRDVRC